MKMGDTHNGTKMYGKLKNVPDSYYQKHFLLVLGMVISHYQKFRTFELLIIGVISSTNPLGF